MTTNLSNGTFLSINQKKIIALSNDFTTLRTYNYNSYGLEETYLVGQLVLSQATHSLHRLLCFAHPERPCRQLVSRSRLPRPADSFAGLWRHFWGGHNLPVRSGVQLFADQQPGQCPRQFHLLREPIRQQRL